jgi:hypothetical protein
VRCPVTQDLHNYVFDEASSSYFNHFESFKCTSCGAVHNEYNDIYKSTREILNKRKIRTETSCSHQWQCTGGNYAFDITFHECLRCGKMESR